MSVLLTTQVQPIAWSNVAYGDGSSSKSYYLLLLAKAEHPATDSPALRLYTELRVCGTSSYTYSSTPSCDVTVKLDGETGLNGRIVTPGCSVSDNSTILGRRIRYRTESFAGLWWEDKAGGADLGVEASLVYRAHPTNGPYNSTTCTISTTVETPAVYALRYALQGGRGEFAPQYAMAGESLCLHAAEPQRAGYRFLGWERAGEENPALLAPGEAVSPEGDVTLQAVWEARGLAHVFADGRWLPCLCRLRTAEGWTAALPLLRSGGEWRVCS